MKAQRDLSKHVCQLLLNQLVPGQWDAKLDPERGSPGLSVGMLTPQSRKPSQAASALTEFTLALSLLSVTNVTEQSAPHCSEGFPRPFHPVGNLSLIGRR